MEPSSGFVTRCNNSFYIHFVHVMCFSIALGTSNPGIELLWTCKADEAFSISELARTNLDNKYHKRLGQI